MDDIRKYGIYSELPTEQLHNIGAEKYLTPGNFTLSNARRIYSSTGGFLGRLRC